MAKSSSRFVRYILVCVVSIFHQSLQISGPDDPTYTAGVVEFQPQTIGPSETLVQANLAGYRDIIQNIEAINTDIIIFPESTLNNDLTLTYVPHPEEHIVPCNATERYMKFLTDISCYARSSRKYIVINISEKEDCTPESQALRNDTRPCAMDGLTRYNTNVVFDRTGMVVSRYRKTHLYWENKNVTVIPEVGTFTTDFGVTFGQFICFDILFYTPSMDMVESGVTDFIFPTMWFSELPFLTALQIQQSWAYSNNVNLLAAGASNPKAGSTGTGIYAGRSGALVTAMNSTPERKLYVATIPKVQRSPRTPDVVIRTPDAPRNAATPRAVTKMDDLVIIPDYMLPQYITEVLDIGANRSSSNICHNGFCCTVDIETVPIEVPEKHSAYQYRLAIFNGHRSYQGLQKSLLKTCGIIACTNSSVLSCGTVFKDADNVMAEHVFSSITIQGVFPKAEKVLIMPNNVDQEMLPLSVEEFSFDVIDSGKSYNVEYKLIKPRTNPRTFAIYANYYDSSSAGTVSFSMVLMAVAILCSIIFNM